MERSDRPAARPLSPETPAPSPGPESGGTSSLPRAIPRPVSPPPVAHVVCPFCGGEAVHDQFNRIEEARYQFACVQCRARGPEAPSSEAALAAWKKRI